MILLTSGCPIAAMECSAADGEHYTTSVDATVNTATSASTGLVFSGHYDADRRSRHHL